MTLAELDLKLPNGNGFHDCYIESLNVDYSRRELTIGMRLLLGGPDGPVDPMYRNALIKIADLKAFVIEAPGWVDGDHLFVSNFGADWTDVIDPKIVTAVNGSAPFYSFYISQWNSCIHIAATSAAYEWSEEEN